MNWPAKRNQPGSAAAPREPRHSMAASVTDAMTAPIAPALPGDPVRDAFRTGRLVSGPCQAAHALRWGMARRGRWRSEGQRVMTLVPPGRERGGDRRPGGEAP